MSFFTNKHVIVALIVTPILAVLGWLATDMLVAEKPHVAVKGESYPLVEKSGCRYAGGECELANADFKLALAMPEPGLLAINASHPLEGVKVALGQSGEHSARPVSLTMDDAEGKRWRGTVGFPEPGDRFHLVASAGGAIYFAEVSQAFTEKNEKE